MVKITTKDIIDRLTVLKMTVRGMAGAMPTAAKEMRREAVEEIEDLIEDLARWAR